jgi:hypothetical protein
MPRRCGVLKDKGVDVLGVVLGETDTPLLRRTREARGLAGPDEPVAGAASVDEVVAAAFKSLGKGRHAWPASRFGEAPGSSTQFRAVSWSG